jgi:hypothetical protein
MCTKALCKDVTSSNQAGCLQGLKVIDMLGIVLMITYNDQIFWENA